jgi:hypothetical protein
MAEDRAGRGEINAGPGDMVTKGAAGAMGGPVGQGSRGAAWSAAALPTPNDHIRSLVELLKPATPDLARRWLAALLLAPAAEREAIVRSVEVAMARRFPLAPPGERTGHLGMTGAATGTVRTARAEASTKAAALGAAGTKGGENPIDATNAPGAKARAADRARRATTGQSAQSGPAPSPEPDARLINIRHAPTQGPGYVEQRITTYEVLAEPKPAASRVAKRPAGTAPDAQRKDAPSPPPASGSRSGRRAGGADTSSTDAHGTGTDRRGGANPPRRRRAGGE